MKLEPICTFCGKTQRQVKTMISGPTCFICNECVDLCFSISIEEDRRKGMKREITTHHDGHELNESIHVLVADEPGPGGANHEYRFSITDPRYNMEVGVGSLQFQRGPRKEPGSLAGVTEGAVLAVLIDRIEAFQSGPYKCEENEKVLAGLVEALTWTKKRADARAARGVLGTIKV